jgi:hypothetical protein
MKPEDLVKVWDAPDHSKLTPKQISIRLPILAAARIEAFCEMYPSKTKTQIITDLIATALDQVVEGLPSKKGKFLGPEFSDMETDEHIRAYVDIDSHDNDVSGVYEDIGPKGQFLRLTKKHLRKLEKEAKINEPIHCPEPVIIDYENKKEEH